MPTVTYRNSLSWLAAIALGKPLTHLIEELPAQEDHGLIMIIQSLMVEVPAMIAVDLIDNSSLRHASLLKLEAAIEVIDNVYPALDTLESRLAVDSLISRSFSDGFAEMKQLPTQPLEEELEVMSPLPVEETALTHTDPQPFVITPIQEVQTDPRV